MNDWAKSSYSKAHGNCLEWRASSSSETGNCVPVRGAQVRDSKDPDGPVLTFSGSTWGRFIRQVKQQP